MIIILGYYILCLTLAKAQVGLSFFPSRKTCAKGGHKYYKEKGDPDRTRQELEEIYEEWINLGRPNASFSLNRELRDNVRVVPQSIINPALNPNIKNVATAVGVGTVLYWIISEASRLFPPRNLVPIP